MTLEKPSYNLGRFRFFSDFDSGNLGRIEFLSPTEVLPELKRRLPEEVPEGPVQPPLSSKGSELNFKVWTRPDCQGTPFENGNRTWFYFGMEISQPQDGEEPFGSLRFNLMNLNKQAKLFSQGFSPVVRVESPGNECRLPGEGWRRIETIYYKTIENQFYMSFVYSPLPGDLHQVHYFAFTYPYSFIELEKTLERFTSSASSSIYFHRAVGALSYENKPIHVLTISGLNGLTDVEESIPMHSGSRAKTFISKKYVFLSARVHPGETQSSFIMDGMLKFLLKENDPIAHALRKKYVFKIIPMLNPDGVVRGHYRTDARGINLNRVYGDPDPTLHPSIYFVKKLILYVHSGKVSDPLVKLSADIETEVRPSLFPEQPHATEPPSSTPLKSSSDWYEMTETSRCSEGDESIADFSFNTAAAPQSSSGKVLLHVEQEETSFFLSPSTSTLSSTTFTEALRKNSGIAEEEDFSRKLECSLEGPADNLFLYLDIHGHASKRGIFMYGNHFRDMDTKIDSMLLPKLVSINCPNFDFPACNFTERNMYLKDRHTGAGREGCGRVAVYKATGLIYSYTLEANFNTGREMLKSSKKGLFERPPKYTPSIYEDAGKAVAVSILDLTDSNPLSCVAFSQSKSIKGVRESIRRFIKASEEQTSKGSTSSSPPNAESSGRLLRRRSAPPGKKSSFESPLKTESKVPRMKSSSEKGTLLLPGISRPNSPTIRSSSAARTTRNKKNNKKSLVPSPNMASTEVLLTASPPKNLLASGTRKKKKVNKRKTTNK